MKIENLTKEQEAQLPVYRDKWLAIGLNTEPANREECEKGIRLAYEIAELKPPKSFEWFDSPKAMVDKVGKDALNNMCYGQQDAYWLGFYEFFREECGLKEETDKLRGLLHQSKHGGWWAPYEDVCYCSERPEVIRFDEEKRLHSTDSPAIRYRDGFSVYAVHGVRLPDWIIEQPEKINPKTIDEENNAEIRRVMLDKYGWDKYLLQSKAKKLHEDECGILYQKELEGDEPITMVKVVDSTPKYEGYGKGLSVDEKAELLKKQPKAFANYFIRVPNDMKTAREAVAWTFNMKPEEYNPAFES